MEKTIALAVIVTIVAFASVYSLIVLKGRTNPGRRR
jgi:hypothetical protein